jgi:hypothetical protein
VAVATTCDEAADDLISDRGVVVSLPDTSRLSIALLPQLYDGPQAESGVDGVTSALAVVM